MQFLERAGLLRRNVDAPFLRSELSVPLAWRWFWQHADLSAYEPNTMRNFVQLATRTKGHGPAVLIDCGAHIGVFSYYVSHSCPGIVNGWAFEPGRDRLEVLRTNCARMPIPMVPLDSAVGDFTGRARLVEPGDGDCAYIVVDDSGDVSVTRIDDLGVADDSTVLLKVDVEGFELSVLRGGARTLRDAPAFVVVFEAHAEVCKRQGMEPVDCVRLLRDCGATHWTLSDDLDRSFDLDRPFFEQFEGRIKRDILVWTDPPATGRRSTGAPSA